MSDIDVAPDLAKVKRNIDRMRQQDAPPEDIATYVRGQGLTMEDVGIEMEPPVDTETGLPFLRRAGYDVMMTQEGKQKFLESRYGAENVRSLGEGSTLDPQFKDPDTGLWTQPDPTGFDWGDVTADIAGEAVEILPTLAARTNPYTVAAAGAVGATARQGLSAIIEPGGDVGMSPNERAAHIALTAGVAGGAQKGINLAARGLDYIRPANIGARHIMREGGTQFGQRGARLEAQTGIEFSTGQRTGARSLLSFEGLLRRYPFSAGRMHQFDLRQARQGWERIRSIMKDIDPRQLGAARTGVAVREAFDKTLGGLVRIRRRQADTDYGMVDGIAKNQPWVAVGNLRQELLDIVGEFDVAGGLAARKVVLEAKRILADLSKRRGVNDPDATPLLTAKRAINTHQYYSTATRGSGRLFTDLDTGQQRMLAGRMRDALMKDIEAMGGQGGDDLSVAMRHATTNYRNNSRPINELGESVLGRWFNANVERAPEAIAEGFMKMKYPSEVRSAMAILRSGDPAAEQAVKRHVLQMALEKAAPAAGAGMRGGVGPAFSSAKFLSALPADDVMRAMYSRREFVDIKRTAKALQRVVDRANTEGSPTASLMMMWDAAVGVFTFNPVAIARIGSTALGANKLATTLTTKQGRDALMVLTSTAGWTKKTAAAASTLGLLIADLPGDPDVRSPVGDRLGGLPQVGEALRPGYRPAPAFPGPPTLTPVPEEAPR